METTPAAADCWSIWQRDLAQPPMAVCTHISNRDPRLPVYGVLDMSRPRSLCCLDCARMWSNFMMPSRCTCCGSHTEADELTTVGREMPWSTSSTLLCTARVCAICLCLLPGHLTTVYIDELGELDWSAAADD